MRVPKIPVNFNKRQKFVACVFFLSAFFFTSGFFSGAIHLALGLVLSLLTVGFFFLIVKKDTQAVFAIPIYILPFLYSLSFSFFYLLIPSRVVTMLLSTFVYAFGLYSLFLAQNIFAISAIRTINLLRSARIVSFVITLLVLFFLINIVFSLRFAPFVPPLVLSVIVFLLTFQSLWAYALERERMKEIAILSLLISLMITQLSFALIVWPVDASIYSIFLIGIFYTYLGLSHAWVEKHLFKGILWEYLWVGFLAVFILIAFSKWGI